MGAMGILGRQWADKVDPYGVSDRALEAQREADDPKARRMKRRLSALHRQGHSYRDIPAPPERPERHGGGS